MEDDEFFNSLEREMLGDRALSMAAELRKTYTWYMTEKGPGAIQEKANALLADQPDLHPSLVEATAHAYVVGDAVLVAVAAAMARRELPTE